MKGTKLVRSDDDLFNKLSQISKDKANLTSVWYTNPTTFESYSKLIKIFAFFFRPKFTI